LIYHLFVLKFFAVDKKKYLFKITSVNDLSILEIDVDNSFNSWLEIRIFFWFYISYIFFWFSISTISYSPKFYRNIYYLRNVVFMWETLLEQFVSWCKGDTLYSNLSCRLQKFETCKKSRHNLTIRRIIFNKWYAAEKNAVKDGGCSFHASEIPVMARIKHLLYQSGETYYFSETKCTHLMSPDYT